MRIDIGGGTKPMAGFINLDPVHGEGRWQRMAQVPNWPVEPGTVDAIHASHVMEHIPAGAPRITVFNEAWKALKPGGTFTVIVPLAITGDGQSLWPAYADPTHVSFWVAESFAYFDGRMEANADYGILRWDLFDYWVERGWEGHWVGIKPGKET